MLESCAKFSQLVWKTISIDHITFQVMDLILYIFSGYVASVFCLHDGTLWSYAEITGFPIPCSC